MLPTLDLHGELLHVQVVRHVLVDCSTDESGCLIPIFAAPFGIIFLLGFDVVFLRKSVYRTGVMSEVEYTGVLGFSALD